MEMTPSWLNWHCEVQVLEHIQCLQLHGLCLLLYSSHLCCFMIIVNSTYFNSTFFWKLELCHFHPYKTVNCENQQKTGKETVGKCAMTKVPAKYELRKLQLHVTCCYMIQNILRLPDHQHGPFTFFFMSHVLSIHNSDISNSI